MRRPRASSAALDGIPEPIVIGLNLLAGGAVSFVAVIAVFLSNVPEGLSSAAGMKKAGRSAAYVFGVWGAIALASGVAAWVGCAEFKHFSADVVAGTTAIAAGAILAMRADTTIPEAFENAHDASGLITVAGFLASFALSKLGGRRAGQPKRFHHRAGVALLAALVMEYMRAGDLTARSSARQELGSLPRKPWRSRPSAGSPV